jgi:hypothetical protein
MATVFRGLLRIAFVVMAIFMAMVGYFNDTASAAACDSEACKMQNLGNPCTGGTVSCCSVTDGSGTTFVCTKGAC